MLTQKIIESLLDKMYIAYMSNNRLALEEVLEEIGPIEIIQHWKRFDFKKLKLILEGFYDNAGIHNDDTRKDN